MKITGLRVYQVDLPLKEGRYTWAGGHSVDVFDSTVIELLTDTEHSGFGEACPLGPVYLPAYASGVRCGLQELAPALMEADPLDIEVLNRKLDRTLKGHPYVKSAIDMACWDLLGKQTGLPVCTLLGGRDGEGIELYRAISQRPAEEMASNVAGYRDEGYRRFQLKVGNAPDDDIARIHATRDVLPAECVLVADANTGWQPHEAIRVANAIRDLDVYFEQPCPTFDQCLTVRRRTTLPFVLDEVIDSVDMLMRLHHEQAADAVNIKISKFGGLTKARKARDLCVSLGLVMTLEDTWGGDIITAAISHLAHSTPEAFRFTATDFNSYVTTSIADGAPERISGRMVASNAPGLGVTPKRDILGDPVFSYP